MRIDNHPRSVAELPHLYSAARRPPGMEQLAILQARVVPCPFGAFPCSFPRLVLFQTGPLSSPPTPLRDDAQGAGAGLVLRSAVSNPPPLTALHRVFQGPEIQRIPAEPVSRFGVPTIEETPDQSRK